MPSRSPTLLQALALLGFIGLVSCSQPASSQRTNHDHATKNAPTQPSQPKPTLDPTPASTPFTPLEFCGGRVPPDANKIVCHDPKTDDLRTIQSHERFRVLDISGTSVSDLGPLRGKALPSLLMSKTKVTDLGPLADLGELHWLDASGTRSVRNE